MKVTTSLSPFCLPLILCRLAERTHALSAEWKELRPSKNIAPRRSGHTAFVCDEQPYVFGGYVEEDVDDTDRRFNRYVVNDLWCWKGETWGIQECSGEIPGPRLVGASGTIGRKAYLFGGWDPETEGTGGKILDSIHVLDIDSKKWSKVATPIPGGPISRHVAVSLPVSKEILLHTHRCQDFVLIFDSKTDTIREQATTGPCPSPRGLHAACALTETKVCIFGGAAQDQSMSNEAYVLETTTWTWTVIDTKGENCPTARASPCMCRLDDNTVIVFGGAEVSEAGLSPRGDLWALDLAEGKWTLLCDAADGPPSRNAATLTMIHPDEEGNKQFLLSGGWAPFRETRDDCFVLKVS